MRATRADRSNSFLTLTGVTKEKSPLADRPTEVTGRLSHPQRPLVRTEGRELRQRSEGIAHQLLNTQCAATVEQLGIVEAFFIGETSMGKKGPRPIFAGRWFKQYGMASRCVELRGALM